MSEAGYDSSEEMGEGLSPTSGVYGPVEQDVDESRVVTLLARPEGATEAIISGTMMTLRHNWGLRNGWQTYRLNWPALNADSTVLASVHEGPFVGNARYLLYNVAPRAGGVDIHVHIDFGSPIPLVVDYFAILA